MCAPTVSAGANNIDCGNAAALPLKNDTTGPIVHAERPFLTARRVDKRVWRAYE
jgi:hypothetical protein